jgi:hypothetical protein
MTTPAPAVAEGPKGRRRRGYWIPGLIALAVLLGIGLAFGAGDLVHGGPTTLAGPEIARDLAQAIQASEGTPSPPTVHCPHSEPAKAGLQFVCTVTGAGAGAGAGAAAGAGAKRTVHVTETNGRGGLSWRFGS